ncbi:low-density lipoprotein receptor-related protein-like isoform X2 [Watersipora subatra]|uniref:low-density lipoprotein receptor-related protein-like isoform X2 n=1 Tax=Watersipora subatra TaxID=2589382 RepID=UPI00355BDFA9
MKAVLVIVIAAVYTVEVVRSSDEDLLKSADLACPISQTEIPHHRTEPICTRDTDCAGDEKCCDWSDNQHCLKGIDRTPAPGECPRQSMWNDACLAGHVGCRYDAECSGIGEKCCLNFGCGYNECQSIRQHLACPRSVSSIENSTYLDCETDADCGFDEKCCESDNSTVCVSGLDIVPKIGFCPVPLETSDQSCSPTHTECWYDSECGGTTEKCCRNNACDYSECVNMNRDFACPWFDRPAAAANPISDVSTCSIENGTCSGFGLLCCPTGMSHSGDLVQHCLPAILHRPKAGQCPPSEVLQHENAPCLENYHGNCGYDEDCYGNHKCCETACGYKQCLRLPGSQTREKRLEHLLEILESES